MDFVAQLNRLLEPIRNRIRMVVSRALVSVIDDFTKMQVVQLNLMKGETKDGVERIQNYGFTSHPLKRAEAVVVFVNGNRDQGLVIAVDDTRYRLKGLPSGGVAVYDYDENFIKLTKDNGIEVEAPKKDVKIKAFGNIEIGNSSLKKLINESFKSTFDNHVHNVSVAGTPVAQTGITSSPVTALGLNPIIVPPVPTSSLLLLGQVIGADSLTSKVKVQ